MKLVITGATGYIGLRLVRLALRRGHEIVCASRRRPPVVPAAWLPFDLRSNNEVDIPVGTAAVIHLAADTSSSPDGGSATEVRAVRMLLNTTQRIGGRFILVSSQTAASDAPTEYGRTKWLVEREVLAGHGTVIRAGMVYGGEERGLFGTLAKLVKRWQFIPHFLPIPRVQPIHVDDLALGLLLCAERQDAPSRVLCLAAQTPVSFTRFMRIIAAERVRRRCFPIPLPVPVIRFSSLLMTRQSWRNLGLERLESLLQLQPMTTAPDLQFLGLELRALTSGMHRSGNDKRRRILREGRAFLIYVLRMSPQAGELRRYARAIESLRDGGDLQLPPWLLSVPMMFALLDDSSARGSSGAKEFVWRLNAATALAEATPAGAARFLGLRRPSGPMPALLRLSIALAAELFWRSSRSILMRLMPRSMRLPTSL